MMAQFSRGVYRPNGLARGQLARRGEKGPYGLVVIIFLTTAIREETPILIMISRRKVFTVLVLMFIRSAISLLLRPCTKYSKASRSRPVRLNCCETCDKAINAEEPLSSRTATLA